MVCYLSLGSNLGDRLSFLLRALNRFIRQGNGIRSCSSVYETQPMEVAEQPDFLNLVVEAETLFSPPDLLQCCLEIERHLGRRRDRRFGPRIVDVDILLYESMLLETEQLRIPHPRLHLRRFVLVPLCEIAPQVVHPRLGQTAGEILAGLRDSSRVERYCGRLL